jgi:hypothetical protein
MKILVTESAQVPGIENISLGTPTPTMALASPWLRPRLSGYRTAERGKAYDAKFADEANIQFTVRLAATSGDVLNNFQALLTVEQAPLLGQDPGAVYPSFVTDVSGMFAVEGRISVNVGLYGVCRAVLTLIRRTANATPTPTAMFTLVQVLGNEKGLDIEHKLIDRGES